MLYDKYLQRRVVWFLFISLAGAILVSFSIETGWGNTTATERQQIALFAILVPLPSIALLVWDYLRRRAGQSHHISLRDLFTGLLIFATIAVLLRHWQSARREEALALDISLVGDQPHVVVKRVHRSFNPRVLPELRTLTHLTVESREIDESWIEALSELSYLQQLELIDCRIAPGGLAALQRHFALEYLSLERCLIDDEALQFLTRLDTLQRLNLRGTQVTGDCVDQLLEFPRLQELDLRDTLCSQEGLLRLTLHPRLDTLWLDNMIIDELPDLRLASLRLDNCTLSGAAYRQIGTMDLAHLQLSNCNVTDKELIILNQLKNLRMLDVSNTKVTDDGFARMRVMSHVASVNIANTAIGDDTVARISSWPNVNTLILDGTLVTDAGIAELRSWRERSGPSRSLLVSVSGCNVTSLMVHQLSSIMRVNVREDGARPSP